MVTNENYGSLTDVVGGKRAQAYIIVTCLSSRNDSAPGRKVEQTRRDAALCMNVNTEFINVHFPQLAPTLFLDHDSSRSCSLFLPARDLLRAVTHPKQSSPWIGPLDGPLSVCTYVSIANGKYVFLEASVSGKTVMKYY